MLYLLSPFWLKHLPLKKEPYHYLRFEKESRYYELHLAQDLLEDWILISSNGRIKSKLGQSRTQAFTTFNEALAQLYSAVKLRQQRQYHMTCYLVEDLIYIILLLNQTSHLTSRSKDELKIKKSTNNEANKKQINHKFNNSRQICFLF